MRSRLVTAVARIAAACLMTGAVAAAGGCAAGSEGPAGGGPGPVAQRAAAGPPDGSSPAARACGGLGAFSPAAAAGIMAGQVTLPSFPPATVDPRRDGHIDFRLDPFHHPTWVSEFRSGGWIETLVAGYLAGGPGAGAYRARAAAITASWLRGVPVPDRNPATLICLSRAFPGQAWITGQIPATVDYYAAHPMGAWNHGLMQDLELLRIGCAYPARAFGGAALAWRRTAMAQITGSFGPNRLGPAIDAQGAVNEQATLYEDFVYNLWRTGLPELRACGYRLPGWITARIAELPAFLGYATEPDGNLAQIGDTYVEHPAVSPRQPRLVAVYRAGYVFGRSGWGPGASFYTLRFGRGRQVHGHDDHMGLTYFARGRDLIVEAGHTGYEHTPYRAWLRSPEASSVLVMPGVPFGEAAPTAMVSDRIGRDGQFYEFSDTAFGGHPRDRSVYVSQRPDLAVVFDRAWGAPSYQELWHLDPALRVTRLGRASATATAPGTALELRQVPLPGQVIPHGSTAVVRGQAGPYQGWVSRQMLERTPADVVTMTRPGPGTAMLTVLVPAAPGTPVTTAISGPAAGPWTLRVRTGPAVTSFAVTADGVISRAG